MAPAPPRDSAPPVFPRSAVLWAHGLCAALFVLYAAMAALTTGLAQLAAIWIAAAAALLWVAAARVTSHRTARDDEPLTAHLDLRTPGVVVASLLGAWALMLAASTLWAALLLTGGEPLDAPGFVLLTIAGALASLPDLYRLVTGRLHTWTLRTDETGVHYTGWRTRRHIAWRDLTRATTHPAAAVTLFLRGEDHLRVSITPFDVTPAGLVTRLNKARKLPH